MYDGSGRIRANSPSILGTISEHFSSRADRRARGCLSTVLHPTATETAVGLRQALF
jgi:hypothetical protein